MLLRRLLFVTLCLLFTSGALADDQAKNLEIRQLKAEMKQLWVQGKFDKVIPRALRLYELTNEPRQLSNIALCYGKLRRPFKELEYFEKFVKTMPANHSTVVEARKRIRELREQLGQTHTEMTIESIPQDAQVHIDGKLIGTTPLVRWVQHGVRKFVVRKAGYESLEQNRLITNSSFSRTFTLTKASYKGFLTVNCNLIGAQVYLDKHFVGLTPLVQRPLVAGKHRIRVVPADVTFLSWEQEVMIVAKETQTLDVQLTKAPPEGPNPYRIAAWTLLGVGVATLGGGLAMQLLARKEAIDANNFYGSLTVEEQKLPVNEKIFDDGFAKASKYQKVGMGLFISGGAVLATSVVLFFIKPKRKRRKLSRTDWNIVPVIKGNQYGFVGEFRF